MVLWEIFAIAGLICLILEMIIPSMFFLNLAIAGFITSIISIYLNSWIALTIIFVFLSILSILFLRPILIKSQNESKEQKTGIEGKYIGKEARVIDTITKNSGAISIYDERWEARTNSDEEIPAGSMARIIKNESLVMYVEKV